MSQSPVPSEHRRPVQEGLDQAGQSLADALRVSFWFLKVLMALLLVLYLVSGVFNVREQEEAVRLRFGQIIGRPDQQVLKPGGPYFSWPYPFEQVVIVPTSPQQIQINRAFWYETNGGTQVRSGPLHPEKDGSLLTGDAEVVHARWSVTYTVADPIAYLKNVKQTDIAERLVGAAVEQSVVSAVAGITADELVRSQHVGRAKLIAQDVLDRVGTGIRITTLSVKNPVFPVSIQPAVQAVLNAESVRAKLIDEAHEQWGRILVGTAGEAYKPLLELIEAYELTSQTVDTKRIGRLEKRLDRSFAELVIRSDRGTGRLGGKVAETIHAAQTYRTQVVAQVRSEADYFTNLLPQYRANPRIVLNRLWHDAWEQILTGDIETMYVPNGQAYLELNRDPKIQLERERKKLRQEKQTHPTAP